MGHGEFLWHDLATFDVDRACDYYADLLGWQYTSQKIYDGPDYFYAQAGSDVVAGIYEMPERYRDEGMQSFWMTYIGVDDIGVAVSGAEAAGGSVVMGPASFGHGAAIAMIADPGGAYFTLFTGQYLRPLSRAPKVGAPFWRELRTRDLKQATDFYRAMFNWHITPDPDGRGARVHNMAEAPAAAIRVVEDASGPAQWVVTFAVEDLAVAREKSRAKGGTCGIAEGEGLLSCADFNGAGFHLAGARARRSWF